MKAPPAEYRSIESAARTVKALLVISIAVSVLVALSDLWYLRDLGKLDDFTYLFKSYPSSDTSVTAQFVTTLVWLATFIATAVFFLIWFYRAYRNIVALGSSEIRRGFGWAIGGWFVPILAFWRPKQIANDIWRGSDPELPANTGAGEWEKKEPPATLNWWWALWIITGVIDTIVFRIESGVVNIEDVRFATTMSVISAGPEIAAAILAITVISLLTARQKQRFERVGSELMSAQEDSAHETLTQQTPPEQDLSP